MQRPFDHTSARLNKNPLNEQQLLSGPYWAELRIFLAVAKSKSFNRAAKILKMSQPTVSRHVRWLQDVMGSQLIISSSNGIALTDKGKDLAELLIGLDEKLFSISQVLSAEFKDTDGVVRVSSTEAIAGLFVIPKLGSLALQYPKIKLHLRNITNMSDFRENQSDIVIGFSPSEQPGIKSVPVGVVHLMPFASTEYIQQFGSPNETNLEYHRFVDAEYYSARVNIWNAWRTALKRGEVAHICDNSYVYCFAVKAGLGIGLLGSYVIADPELIPVSIGVHVPLHLYLLVDEERFKSRPVKAVFNWLSTILGESNRWLGTQPNTNVDLVRPFGETLSRALLDDLRKESQ